MTNETEEHKSYQPKYIPMAHQRISSWRYYSLPVCEPFLLGRSLEAGDVDLSLLASLALLSMA